MEKDEKRAAPFPRSMRFREEDLRRLRALKDLWGCSEVAVLRRLLLDAAKREGLDPTPPPGSEEP